MNNRTLEEINSDLNVFYEEISDLAKINPRWYDEYLKIPTWQKDDKIEDYLNEILADAAKFSTHVDIILHPDKLMTDENMQKDILLMISERLVQHIQLYVSYNTSKYMVRYQQLLADLKNLQKILQKLSLEKTRKPR